ncbi:C-terminal processing peptidase [Planctomyces bekefii]|uniref:C-terminal processing peptidase n=1 Tax=Planctomyces bekefii TaxID=1653850 RepID=A0A5C6M719_9PLAN|nr:C-terminal processing peptidase [Planctomyces bekefii]
MIMDSDCKAIDKVVKLYSKRFDERQRTIDSLIDSKMDFTVDESMVIDRKKMEFAPTVEEVNERWRQRVKFQLLQLKQTMGDLAKARDKLKKTLPAWGQKAQGADFRR